jgi:hypothetical protein
MSGGVACELNRLLQATADWLENSNVRAAWADGTLRGRLAFARGLSPLNSQHLLCPHWRQAADLSMDQTTATTLGAVQKSLTCCGSACPYMELWSMLNSNGCTRPHTLAYAWQAHTTP